MNGIIKVFKQSESSLFVDTHPSIEQEISRYFSARIENWRFHPLCKQGIWDGYIRYYANGILPIGLLNELYTFAAGHYEIELQYDPPKEVISLSDFQRFVQELALPFEPRDYQFQSAFDAINQRHLSIKSVTSSGKSLIIYLFLRFMDFTDQKSLLVVPSVSLVNQMFGDFKDYGWTNAHNKCHQLYSGQTKVFDAPVIISTYQSLLPLLKPSKSFTQVDINNLFNQFNSLMIDEAHGNNAEAKSIKKISDACTKASWRVGLSGTFPDYKTADWFTIVGTTGPIVEYSTYRDLQDQGHIANLKIYNLYLKYPRKYREYVFAKSNKEYAKEVDLVNDNPARHKFIFTLAMKMKENCLILFTKKEKHGYPLKELFERLGTGKKILYVDGDTPPKEREEIRAMAESRNDVIIIASYGVFSVGVNIKNIHHLIFASGYKSKIKVLQSIGRILRKHADKEFAKLYDIIDDLSIKEERYINFSLKHFKERIEYYNKEKFIYKNLKFDIDCEPP